MALIKKFELSDTTIEIHDDYIPKDKIKLKSNLSKMYDVINDIADKMEKNNCNCQSWFLTEEELRAMKESGNYNFI